MERHYGMDWLRIGAFALLILYHVGMVFVPWGYQVKVAHPLVWAEVPMFLTSPWRLTLLFVVSGYASRALGAKMPGAGAFFRQRSARLLLPLAFGMAVIVPPQTWVELVSQHGYIQDFGHFWLHDYFRFGTLDGIIMPTWNHLWFVAYLWVYTAGLALLMLLPLGRAQAWFDNAFTGWRALILPAAYFILLEAVLFDRPEDTHTLFNDTVAHLRYIPAFLFGFGLAGSPLVMTGLARHWKTAAAAAVGCYATMATLLIVYPDFSFPDHATSELFRLARHGETWTAIGALIGIAETFWNRDHRWRRTLTEAVFPFYIIHQTVIVLVGWAILPFALPTAAAFAILVAATVAGCWAFYLGGRQVAWLRPLIGLRMAAPALSAKRRGHDGIERLDPVDPRWRRPARAWEDCA
ncbi:MAG: acyltransferase family protein [Sphingomonas sp.]